MRRMARETNTEIALRSALESLPNANPVSRAFSPSSYSCQRPLTSTERGAPREPRTIPLREVALADLAPRAAPR